MNTIIIILLITVFAGLFYYLRNQKTNHYSKINSTEQDPDFTNGDCSDYHGMGHA